MKKTLLTQMALALLLTACASTSPTAISTVSPAQQALPASTQLILGIFKLEGTAGAVTAEQAAALLPLWQVYQELDASGTAAQVEIDALLQQIQATMSESQVASIQSMGLTRADVMAVMAGQGLVEASPQQGSGSTASAGGPQGMPPGDMGGDPAIMGGVAPVSASVSGSDSEGSQAQAGSGVPLALLDALIRLLQTRAA